MQEKEFNQTDYIREYNKKHYSSLKINLKKEEKEELDKLLKENGWTKPQFIRIAIEVLKKSKDQE